MTFSLALFLTHVQSTSPEDPIFWVHHAFIDKIWYEHQTLHGIKYEGDVFNDVESDTTVVGYDGWAKQVRAVLNINDICIAYAEPNPANMGVSGDNETIRAPEIAENWLNGTGANVSFVEELQNETKRQVTRIDLPKWKKPKAASGAATLFTSVLVVAVSMFAFL